MTGRHPARVRITNFIGGNRRGSLLPARDLVWHYPHYANQGGRPAGALLAAMPTPNPQPVDPFGSEGVPLKRE